MSILVVFQPLKKLFGLGSSKATISSVFFLTQTKLSASLLLVLALLANGRQYFGDPIRCRTGKGSTLSLKLVDSYCWVTGTYTLTEIHQDQAHPGVGVHDPLQHGEVVHGYYQWVSFILILQATLFYLPRFVWKKLESGRVEAAVEGMHVPEMDKEKLGKRIDKLLKNLYKYEDHRLYSFFFIMCETLNFINVILQIIMTDKFLGNRFVDYGSRYFQHTLAGDHDFVHPLHAVFPHVASCNFSTYSSAGKVVVHDILCMLPLNIINEKIFLALWVWLWFLVAVAFVNALYRISVFISPQVRTWIFHFGIMEENKKGVYQVCDGLDYGEWFYIGLIRDNIDTATFGRFVELLARQKGRKISKAESRGTNGIIGCQGDQNIELRSASRASLCTTLASQEGSPTNQGGTRTLPSTSKLRGIEAVKNKSRLDAQT